MKKSLRSSWKRHLSAANPRPARDNKSLTFAESGLGVLSEQTFYAFDPDDFPADSFHVHDTKVATTMEAYGLLQGPRSVAELCDALARPLYNSPHDVAQWLRAKVTFVYHEGTVAPLSNPDSHSVVGVWHKTPSFEAYLSGLCFYYYISVTQFSAVEYVISMASEAPSFILGAFGIVLMPTDFTDRMHRERAYFFLRCGRLESLASLVPQDDVDDSSAPYRLRLDRLLCAALTLATTRVAFGYAPASLQTETSRAMSTLRQASIVGDEEDLRQIADALIDSVVTNLRQRRALANYGLKTLRPSAIIVIGGAEESGDYFDATRATFTNNTDLDALRSAARRFDGLGNALRTMDTSFICRVIWPEDTLATKAVEGSGLLVAFMSHLFALPVVEVAQAQEAFDRSSRVLGRQIKEGGFLITSFVSRELGKEEGHGQN